MPSSFVAVTGLPRAGSTLLCQLLAQHPESSATGRVLPCATCCSASGAWRTTGRGRDASYLTPPAQIRLAALLHTAPTISLDAEPLTRKRMNYPAWRQVFLDQPIEP